MISIEVLVLFAFVAMLSLSILVILLFVVLPSLSKIEKTIGIKPKNPISESFSEDPYIDAYEGDPDAEERIKTMRS